MYKIGNTVMYGTTGVCRIEEITECEFGGVKKSYYILKPLFQDGAKMYIPKDNEKLVSKMRKVLSADEVKELIYHQAESDVQWIDKDNERKQLYSQVLDKGDRRQMIALIKTVLKHQSEQVSQGKKLHICDENFLTRAQRILYDEFSMVLHIKREDVLPMIMGETEIPV